MTGHRPLTSAPVRSKLEQTAASSSRAPGGGGSMSAVRLGAQWPHNNHLSTAPRPLCDSLCGLRLGAYRRSSGSTFRRIFCPRRCEVLIGANSLLFLAHHTPLSKKKKEKKNPTHPRPPSSHGKGSRPCRYEHSDSSRWGEGLLCDTLLLFVTVFEVWRGRTGRPEPWCPVRRARGAFPSSRRRHAKLRATVSNRLIQMMPIARQTLERSGMCHCFL